MKQFITFKIHLIFILLFTFLSFSLYPQRNRTGNIPQDGEQIKRNDHDRGNDSKKPIETGERKDHTGIKIERPNRIDNPPKIDPGRNDEKVIDQIQVNNPDPPVVHIEIVKDYIDEPVRYHPVRPFIKKSEEIYDPIASGLAKLEELDYLGALKDFNNAIETDTANYELYYYRGLAYLKLKNYIESIEDFDVYLDYFFYDMEGYFQRGLAKFYLREKVSAFDDFSIASDMGHKIAASILKRFY